MISKNYKQYIFELYKDILINKEENYVYKSCYSKWIIIFEKLPDTLTNETRHGIYDKDFASYRANKLQVKLIIDKFDIKNTISTITNSTYKASTVNYQVDTCITIPNYNTDIEEVNTFGIHYFTNIIVAYYYDLKNIMQEGKYYEWWKNGNKKYECTIVNNKENGIYIQWFDNGKIWFLGNKLNGNNDGKLIEWNKNCIIIYEYNYSNMQKNGTCCRYYEDGYILSKCNYKNDKYDGLVESYYDNCVKNKSEEYQQGQKHGSVKSWFYNGAIQTEENWIFGKRDGICNIYNVDGTIMHTSIWKDGITDTDSKQFYMCDYDD